MTRPTDSRSRPRTAARTLVALAALILPVAWAHAQIYLRGHTDALPGTIGKVSVAGVQLEGEATADPAQAKPGKVIGWDLVRQLRGLDGELATQAARFKSPADSLWRARTRLERGDFLAATPLLETLYEKGPFGPTGGPSSAVLYEGVLRSRLFEGRSASAVWPWLDWLRLRSIAGRKGRDTWQGGSIKLAAIVDPDTGLSGRLPPIFSLAQNGAALRALSTSDQWKRYEEGDELTRDLAALFALSVRFEVSTGDSGVSPELPLPALKLNEEPVLLVAEIVRSRVATAEERALARARLRKRIDSFSAPATADPLAEGSASSIDAAPSARWMESWCRAALGRSLLRDPDPTQQRLGIIELLHVPARFADATPELAALALREAADAIERLGDSAGARRLRSELMGLTGQIPDTESSESSEPTGDEAPPPRPPQ